MKIGTKPAIRVKAKAIPSDELCRRADRACAFLWTMGFITDLERTEIGIRILERDEWPEGHPARELVH